MESRSPRLLDSSTSELDDLAALIEASLLRRVDVDDQPRFGMLETVREYAIEQLIAAGEFDAAQARFAAWCRDLVATAAQVIRSGEQARGFRSLEIEQDNLRAAMGWALARDDAELTLRLISGPLWYFWSMRGWIRGERHWLERALTLAEREGESVDPIVLVKAQFDDGLFYLETGNYDRACARFDRALELMLALGEEGRTGVAMILNNLATLDVMQSDYDRARERCEESRAIRRALGIAGATAVTLVNLSGIVNLQGDYEAATRLLDEALPVLRELGDERTMAYCLNNLGEAAAGQGHDVTALPFFDRALALFRQRGDLSGEGTASVNLAVSSLRLGDVPSAAAALSQALDRQRDLPNPVVVAAALDATAEVAVATSRPSLAPRFLAAAAAIREGAGTVVAPAVRRRVERTAGAARSALGRHAFDVESVAGRTLSVDQAIAAATAFLTELTAEASGVAGTVQAAYPSEAAAGPAVILTVRQREVLRLLVDGLTDPEIANALGIGVRTVESHVTAILNKLGVHSRTAAVVYAVRHRFV